MLFKIIVEGRNAASGVEICISKIWSGNNCFFGFHDFLFHMSHSRGNRPTARGVTLYIL